MKDLYYYSIEDYKKKPVRELLESMLHTVEEEQNSLFDNTNCESFFLEECKLCLHELIRRT